MKATLFLSLLLGAATAAQAQVPPTQLAKPGAAAPAAAPKIPGVSDAGVALFVKSQPGLRASLTPLAQQQQALGQQLGNVVSAPTLDVAKFASLLQQRRALTGQISAKQDEWIVGLLNQMSPADRGPFLRAIASARPAGAQGPAPH